MDTMQLSPDMALMINIDLSSRPDNGNVTTKTKSHSINKIVQSIVLVLGLSPEADADTDTDKETSRTCTLALAIGIGIASRMFLVIPIIIQTMDTQVIILGLFHSPMKK